MTDPDPYGFDPETDTLRVRRHDLARLLLQFRSEVENDGRRAPWSHNVDYDRSFERLADAVDHANAIQPYGSERGPDYRMRCKRTAAYIWPDHAPYDGGEVEAVTIRATSTHNRRPESHYAWRWEGGGFGYALCGFQFVREDLTRRPLPDVTCRQCAREKDLAAALGGPR